MATKPRSPIEVQREGFDALLERLGPADAIRFLQQYDSGHGDYTAERHKWLDGLTVDEVVRAMEKEQAEGGVGKNGE